MRALAAALLAGALLAGCGGGGDGPLSRADYTARAGAACRDANRRIAAIPAPRGRVDIPAYASRAGRELDRGIAALRALRPPPELAADARAFLALAGRTRALATELEHAARAGDERALRAASARGDVLDARSNVLARRMGIEACADAAAPAP